MQPQTKLQPETVVAPQSARTIKLSARDLSRYYGETVALDRVDLDVHEGEFLTLLGPSGSGKTTLLQTICGLNLPSRGQLMIDGTDHTHTRPEKRGIGVVFQNYALFPHLTVAENIGYPLNVRGIGAREIAQRVGRSLETVGLGHAGNRFPNELSGGQQQRVALARCLVYDPSIILMDEPLSALDRKLREQMQMEIKRIHRETDTTIIFVTHDQEEALALSERICLMRDGRIVQAGTPSEMYDTPNSVFVADFIGISNIFEGQVSDGALDTPDGRLPLPPGRDAAGRGSLVLRPEMMRIDPDGPISGTVTDTIYAGAETRLLVTTASGKEVILRVRSGPIPAVGAAVRIGWDRERGRFLTREV
ncbi:ABC transporter ATP-binding protein [Salipiger mucosus]|uniref:Putrescine transport ATP-binding protein PotA n=1 Tax=Salipiger mucosus DSM 16094 TaxID=1123237 RepID=S9RRQ2_9RHOB|nr:ABC transporter ATP-binding protein [Salipiger mucosus]EPX76614.1 Putrescine transport ATP-binding protein PotA [Salipiger mucosus DSM 16094]